MALPKKLKYFNTFIDGTSYIGEAESITLPKLTQKLESYRGAGMPGAVKINLGLDDDALELEFTMGGLVPALTKKLGGSISSTSLRFAGAFQQDDSEEYIKYEVEVTGRLKDEDSGEKKQGENTQIKYSMAAVYYKLTVDGEEVLEIDIINMVYKVNGKDILESARQAIGL
ncbi:phage major tail tube protein [Utexia brackfieldae]|uniref:phage major tail tube protein n=1 Tax=Utexia brackfieldae TaxID=3074108 RepID=UPI00370DAACC